MSTCCVCGECSKNPAVFWFGAVCLSCALRADKEQPGSVAAKILLAAQPGLFCKTSTRRIPVNLISVVQQDLGRRASQEVIAKTRGLSVSSVARIQKRMRA